MGRVEYQCVLQVLALSKRDHLAIMSTFQIIIAFKIHAVIFYHQVCFQDGFMLQTDL